jgi:serine/threonine-protein kinase
MYCPDRRAALLGSIQRMPLANGEVFAGFQILRPLGFGGMGEVYLVAHPRLPRQDALKILPAGMSADAEFRARFNREAELAATLYNPHIVGIHDRGEWGGQLWISMDFIDGPDAGRLLREHYPAGMPPWEVAGIVTAVADALDYAHARGLLHRDIKPSNILLTNPDRGRRRVLLADFGIARNAAEANGLTDTNVTLGTVDYAAPEQLMGAQIDGRADQYGLAATAYHLLSGSPMFAASNPAVVVGRHLNAPPPRLADTRPALGGLDPVLAKALSKNPEDRFRTCTGFANALSRAAATPVSGPPRTAPPTTRSAPPVPPRAQHTAVLPPGYPGEVVADGSATAADPARWPWVLAALALVIILAAIVFAVWPLRERSTATPAATTSRSATAPSSAAAPTAAASMSTAPPLAAPITFETMRDLVTGFYAELPGDARSAWTMLDSHYQQRNGLNDFLGFWSTIESVSVLSVTPRDETSVVATVRYTLRAGGSDTEKRWLSVVRRDGRLLIYDSERIGPA